MQTINGQTKTQFLREASLRMLEGFTIKPTVDTSATVHTSKGGVLDYIEMHQPTYHTQTYSYRVTEDSDGWVLQKKSSKALKWVNCLHGKWTATTPLFDAIKRRNVIHKAQIKRGVA